MSLNTSNVASSDSVDAMISEGNALVESVFRYLGGSPARRRNRQNALSPRAERQIAAVNEVINSVDDNLSLRPAPQVNASSAQATLEVIGDAHPVVQGVRQPEGAVLQVLTDTPVRSARQQNDLVVIDLCLDSPKNDDVILVPNIVPGVINVDSPIVRSRRNNSPRRRIAVDNNVGNRERSRSPNAAASNPTAPLAALDEPAAGGLQCPICMEECNKRQPTTTKCGHIYCKECITEAIRLTQKCPICKGKLNSKNLIRLYI